VGAILDSRWTGAMLEGARVYPLEAYRVAFLACTLCVLIAAALSLLLRETRGQNIYHQLYPGGRPGQPSLNPIARPERSRADARRTRGSSSFGATRRGEGWI